MRTTAILAALAAATAMLGVAAQAQGTRIYRCGNEYTNDAKSAAARGCKPIEGGNVTVIQSGPPAGAGRSGGSSSASPGAATASPSAQQARVDGSVQRNRDQEARRILQAELEKHQARLRELQAEYQDGTPERLGSERNYQRYLDRTAQLKADIERTQGDIDGLQREISRFPP